MSIRIVITYGRNKEDLEPIAETWHPCWRRARSAMRNAHHYGLVVLRIFHIHH